MESFYRRNDALPNQDKPGGFQFLNAYLGDLEVAVEWQEEGNFGLSCFRSHDDPVAGAFDAPDEWYQSSAGVFHRICSLLLDQKQTRAERLNLAELRRELGISQERIAAEASITQATYSKQERCSDMKVSTLRRAIEAMGGKLKIMAQFPDARNIREISF